MSACPVLQISPYSVTTVEALIQHFQLHAYEVAGKFQEKKKIHKLSGKLKAYSKI